ncbi:hypothetical protein F4779DRAFT_603629 [Xylariaceae sp. FL0662B]|nr:hypothetical protein F4779DRAFT_603629 [Xylariaceae sp. FL0662B]
MSSLLTLEHLDPEHLDAATKAIHNLISSDIAESAFSQIVDGMPTKKSYIEFHSPPHGHLINDTFPCIYHPCACYC